MKGHVAVLIRLSRCRSEYSLLVGIEVVVAIRVGVGVGEG